MEKSNQIILGGNVLHNYGPWRFLQLLASDFVRGYLATEDLESHIFPGHTQKYEIGTEPNITWSHEYLLGTYRKCN